ncbi:flagellar M-ring protein FliF [Clostridium sp. CAG:768]|jgi:flagellar M-ring protein FliF|uniref:flagellar M-ring protein FliF C-terminal domain-containing protein n=1 Tax=Candidatus Stercorousia sp. TaxID=3048886 RepID=UPI00033C7A1F|nr:flagellar M-ring protein FliF [Clostridium sp. CAG:768]
MDFQKILENKPLLYGVIGAVVLILALFVTIGIVSSSSKPSNGTEITGEPLKADVDLLTTDNAGKAIEIQALLAKYDIAVSRRLDGTKSILYLKKGDCKTGRKACYTTDRDQALIQIVQSGLMDQNVGLEIFDKGDFTSTKEDKKIRLSRAINGELSRLIRRINGIENASVFISIPEQTMFTSMQKPVTATVQITLAKGDKETRLDQVKVKAITNLLLGSVTGLTAENIAITDTNGNTYHSIMDAEDEMLQRLEENDKYMTSKVNQQLDRLIGQGNYVATVSTFLRQAPVEKYTIDYDPNRKASVTEQTFSEGLGDRTNDSNKNVNAVSVYLPNGLPNGTSDSSQNRNYSRTARETQYGVTKTQTNEYIKPGVVEDISIAVTLDKNALPANTTLEELKELIAKAASPKVNPDNVSIAFSDSTDPYLASDRPANLPKPDETGNPWWLAIALSAIGLIIVFKAVSNKVQQVQEANRREVEMLRQKTAQQEQQLSDINQRAAQLTERQSELAQGLVEQQQRGYIQQQNPAQLADTLSNLSAELSNADDDEAGEKIKSWIEQG